jgi:hypothetical protein
MPGPPTVAVIQAITESVSFDVSVPDMAQIRVTGLSIFFEAAPSDLGFSPKSLPAGGARKPLCLSGVLIPESGTKVTYKRYGTGPLSILVERTDGKPAAKFDLSAGTLPADLKVASWIRLEASTKDGDDADDKGGKAACAGSPMTRLPISGVAEIGAELRPAGRGDEPSSGVLIEGAVDVFGETREIGFLTDPAPRLYPASSIVLPPGSRVTEYRVKNGVRRPWSGFVQPDTDVALDVRVTTPATRLAIVRPGPGMQPEVLAIGLFTQLTNDPVLVSAQLTMAFLFGAFQVLGSIASWWSRRGGEGGLPFHLQTPPAERNDAGAVTAARPEKREDDRPTSESSVLGRA